MKTIDAKRFPHILKSYDQFYHQMGPLRIRLQPLVDLDSRKDTCLLLTK